MPEVPWLRGQDALIDAITRQVVRQALSLLAVARIVHRVLVHDPTVRVAHNAVIRVLTPEELAWVNAARSDSTGGCDHGLFVTMGSVTEVYAWKMNVVDECFPDVQLHVRRYHAVHGLFGLPPGSRELLGGLFRHGDAKDAYDHRLEQATNAYGVSIAFWVAAERWDVPDLPALSCEVGWALLQTLEELRNDEVVSGTPEVGDAEWLLALPELRRRAFAAFRASLGFPS